MNRTATCLLLAGLPLAATQATTYSSSQSGSFWCPGTTCAFSATPGVSDTAVVQHFVTVDGSGAPAPPNPLPTGAVNIVAGGTLGIYGGMRLSFDGGAWSGGGLDACCNGGGTWNNRGVLAVSGNPVAVNGGVLENNATLRVLAGGNLRWINNNSAPLANLTIGGAAAVVEFAGSGQIGGGVTLVNEGIVRKTGAGTSVFYGKLRNLGTSAIRPGTIEALDGTLAVADANGYEGLLVTEGGHIDVAAGAVLSIRDGGQWRLFPEAPTSLQFTTTASGAGHVRLENGGTLLGAVDIAGQRGAVIDFDPGVFEWRGGSFYSYGLRNDGEISILGPDPKSLDAMYLDNAGVIKLQSPLPMSGRLLTLPGGLLEVSDGTSISAGGNNPLFVVDGTLRKLAGAGTFTIADMNLHGSGTVEIVGGHLSLPETGSYTRMGNFLGTLNLIANATVEASGIVLIAQGATVTGVGGLNGNGAEQHGTIAPGAPYGAIEIAGNRLYQANEATTRIAIGGTAPLTQTAQLQIDGDLFANSSTLRVSFRDGFAPNAGDTFDLITFGGTLGTGASYNVVIEGLAPGFQYTLTQTPQRTVRLTALNRVLSLADYVFADSYE